MDWIARLAEHARLCMAHPLGYPPCNGFWGLLFLVGIVVIGIAVIKLILRSYGNWRDEQQVVEAIISGKHMAVPEIKDSLRRKGDKSGTAGLRYDELVGSLKEEPAKRKDALL